MYDTLQRNIINKSKQKKKSTMNNVSTKNILWNGAVQIYVDPPPILLIKSKIISKIESYFIKIN